MSTLEDLLKMQIESFSLGSNTTIEVSPEFTVTVQRITDNGIHFIIHAARHNSDTLDFVVVDNVIHRLGEDVFWNEEHKCFTLLKDLPHL